MNKRTYWNGLGIGLIVGAVLLQLMLAVRGDTPSASGAEPVKPGTDKLYTESDLKAKLDTRLKEELDKRPVATAAPSLATSPAKPKQTVLYIAAGLSSDKIVEMLYQSGLVSQPNEFAAEMKKRDLDGKIRSGVHLFEGAPDWEAIIDNLAHTQP